ncbi:peptidoglycan editing factor PgeF [Actinocrinis puniceicyclus]|uniref:peptidoglycan editing factor PgeF n=1 Tax=Actinocrinis puniceicyclus TaxID=977794 RepID=UPI003F689E00
MAFSGPVRFAFTDRRGGVSLPPYDSLNLGDHVGDDPQAVRTNRQLAARELGVAREQVVYMKQVHGADVAYAGEPWPDELAPSVDALVTDRPGLVLAVLVADCTPVLLADRAAGVVAAVHAGRPGMAAGVVTAAVAAMRELGAQPARIEAYTGPGVCGACYEVPERLRAEVAAREPESWATTRQGTPAIDVAAGVSAQLRRAGVRQNPTRIADGCTMETSQYFSYRRDGVTGRFAGFVWFEED